MPHDAGILTYLLNSFLAAFTPGFGNLKGAANSLLYLLGGIDLTLTALFWALRGENVPVAFVRKMLHIGFFIFLVASWPSLTSTVLNGFVWAGQTAGGGANVSLKDPSSVVGYGFDTIQPISDKIQEITQGGWMHVLSNLGPLMFYGLAMLITLAAFFIIGIQCFMAYLEFYIVAVLMLVMVPFGIFRHTAFLSEKAIGSIISHGVKLMVLAFIVAVAGPVFAQMTPPAGAALTIDVAFCTALGAVAIAMLAMHAPSLAGGMLSGGPSLSAGSAAGAALGTAAGFAALGAGAIAAGGAAAGGASSAAGATIKAAGAMSEGARIGAASMAAGGGAAYSEMAAGAVGGMAQVAGGAAMQPVKASVTKISDAMRQKFNEGRLTGYQYAGGGASNSGGGAPGAAQPGSPAAAAPAAAPAPTASAASGAESQAAAASMEAAAQSTQGGATAAPAASAASVAEPQAAATAPETAVNNAETPSGAGSAEAVGSSASQAAPDATQATAASSPTPSPVQGSVAAAAPTPAASAAPAAAAPGTAATATPTAPSPQQTPPAPKDAVDPVKAGKAAVEHLSGPNGGSGGVQPSLPKDEY
jgi:type IV secretion system protein TrbL